MAAQARILAAGAGSQSTAAVGGGLDQPAPASQSRRACHRHRPRRRRTGRFPARCLHHGQPRQPAGSTPGARRQRPEPPCGTARPWMSICATWRCRRTLQGRPGVDPPPGRAAAADRRGHGRDPLDHSASLAGGRGLRADGGVLRLARVQPAHPAHPDVRARTGERGILRHARQPNRTTNSVPSPARCAAWPNSSATCCAARRTSRRAARRCWRPWWRACWRWIAICE